MNLSVTNSAELATNTSSEKGESALFAFAAEDLESSLDCFSEIDTESFSPENNKIVYLEQLLRLHEPQHLGRSQPTAHCGLRGNCTGS